MLWGIKTGPFTFKMNVVTPPGSTPVPFHISRYFVLFTSFTFQELTQFQILCARAYPIHLFHAKTAVFSPSVVESTFFLKLNLKPAPFSAINCWRNLDRPIQTIRAPNFSRSHFLKKNLTCQVKEQVNVHHSTITDLQMC